MKTYQNQAEWTKRNEATFLIKEELERLRQTIAEEKMSYAEIVRLEELVDYIPLGDVELLQWANVPEFEEEGDE